MSHTGERIRGGRVSKKMCFIKREVQGNLSVLDPPFAPASVMWTKSNCKFDEEFQAHCNCHAFLSKFFIVSVYTVARTSC